MAVLPLTMMSESVLHQKAKRVRRIDDSIQKLIDDMIDTMQDIGGAAGLAAPQVGVPLQVIVVETPDDELAVIINPEIVKSAGEDEVGEGCLSLPGYKGKLKRSEKVTVKGRDRHGKEIRIKAEGLLAQTLQHEVDHVNGIVFLDRMESMDDLREVGDEDEDEVEHEE